MRVVEIGCGKQPGPFFEGAAEHFLVDPDANALALASMADIHFSPIVGSATDLEFEDESVDTVLARNVFGDPSLILDRNEKTINLALLAVLSDEEKYEEIIEHMEMIEDETGLLKVKIMQEAGRILLPSGKLVVVEQLTPKVARKFFEKAADYSDGFDPNEVFDIEHDVPLCEVTPASYAEIHGNFPGLETWVATKK